MVGKFIEDQNMTLQIILVDEVKTVSDMIKDSLEQAGHDVVAQLCPDQDMLAYVKKLSPDMLVVNVKIPDAAFLQNIAEVNRIQPLPVVLFAEVDRKEMVELIVQCGVSAYVVDGLESNRIEPIVNIAMARFSQMTGLRKELADTKQVLAGRKTIDRAKGVIMARRGCTEDEAYNSLRKLAMDRNQRMAEVADNVIATAELLDAM